MFLNSRSLEMIVNRKSAAQLLCTRYGLTILHTLLFITHCRRRTEVRKFGAREMKYNEVHAATNRLFKIKLKHPYYDDRWRYECQSKLFTVLYDANKLLLRTHHNVAIFANIFCEPNQNVFWLFRQLTLFVRYLWLNSKIAFWTFNGALDARIFPVL